jgi:hypothetical protein
MSNPPCTLRGTGINRWEWLCTDPQTTALEPYQRCVNYRTIVKDNHRIESITEPYTAPKMPAEYVPEKHSWSDFSSTGLPERPIRQHWRSAGEVARLGGAWGSEAVLDQRPIAAMCSAAARGTTPP